jgi:hypothetical protein
MTVALFAFPAEDEPDCPSAETAAPCLAGVVVTAALRRPSAATTPAAGAREHPARHRTWFGGGASIVTPVLKATIE